MKECERVSDLFGELYDRRMDHEAEKAITQHLSGCTCCREDFKWYGLTVQVLADLEKISPPDEFLTQLRSRLYAPPRESPFRVFFSSLFSSAPYLPLPIGVTALAFVAVVGFAMYQHMPDMGVPDAPSVATQAPASPVLPVSESRPVVAGDMHGGAAVPWRLQTQLRARQEIPPASSAARPQYVMTSPQQIERNNPTPADLIGADNLTVESASVDQAVESLKRILPNIHGQLVAEKPRTPGEKLVGVVIPSNAYGNLTTELINYGAVQVGAGSESDPPPPTRKDDNNVLLYIRFTNTR